MSKELPSSWLEVAIKDVLEIRNGYAFKSADYQEEGIFLVRQTNLNEGRVTKDNARHLPKDYLEEYEGYTIEKGDLLIGMSGSIGDVSEYKLDEIALQNQRTGLFQFLFSNEFLKKYVQYYLIHIEQNLKNKSKGVAVQNISAKEIESFDLPLPPLKEQQRIVDKIEKLFSKIDDAIKSLQKVKKQLNHYRLSVLKAAVEGKLTQEWREENRDSLESADQLLERILEERRERWEEQYRKKYEDKGKDLPSGWKSRYSDPESPDTSDLADIPEEWTWVTFDQTGHWKGGGTPKRSDDRFWNGSIPWVSPKEMKRKWIEDTQDHTNELGIDESSTKLVNSYSLLFVTRSGILKHTLPTAINTREVTVNQDMKALETVESINTEYLYLCTQAFNGKMLHECSKHGTTVQSLESDRLYNYIIPLSPLAEQQEIVNRVERILSVIDQHKKTLLSELKRARNLKSSVLKKAFRGDLVTQDPDDEPASELLRKIKEEDNETEEQVEMNL